MIFQWLLEFPNVKMDYDGLSPRLMMDNPPKIFWITQIWVITQIIPINGYLPRIVNHDIPMAFTNSYYLKYGKRHGDITKITMIHQKITTHPHVQGKGPTTGGQEEDVDETPREAPSTTVTWVTGDPKLIQFLVNDGETKNHRMVHDG